LKRTEIIEAIQQARASMLQALDGLSPDAMLRPGVVGMWSVKDILAHLAIWQSELITALSQLEWPDRVPEIVQIEDIDEFNAQEYRANVRRSLDVVLEDFHGVHKHLLKMVDDVNEKWLDDPRKFPWMEGEGLWYLIAENGYWHEEEHAENIKQWRQEQGL